MLVAVMAELEVVGIGAAVLVDIAKVILWLVAEVVVTTFILH